MTEKPARVKDDEIRRFILLFICFPYFTPVVRNVDRDTAGNTSSILNAMKKLLRNTGRNSKKINSATLQKLHSSNANHKSRGDAK